MFYSRHYLLTLSLLSAGCGSDEGAESPTPADEATPTSAPATEAPTEPPTAVPTPEPTGNGTLAVRFEMDPDVAESLIQRGYDLVGTFYGAVFDSDDVDNGGPSDGAVMYDTLEVVVDLMPAGEVTDVLYVTGDAPAGKVAILGFIDINTESGSAEFPSTGDVATWPSDNEFTVIADTETEATVLLGVSF